MQVKLSVLLFLTISFLARRVPSSLNLRNSLQLVYFKKVAMCLIAACDFINGFRSKSVGTTNVWHSA